MWATYPQDFSSWEYNKHSRKAEIGDGHRSDLAPHGCEVFRYLNYNFPTRSRPGSSVSPPGSHEAGQTCPLCVSTYCAAWSLRSVSTPLRPIELSFTSIERSMPAGSMMKLPRSARPSSGVSCGPFSSISTPNAEAIFPEGSAPIGYLISRMPFDTSCHALWVWTVSVEKEIISVLSA